MAKNWFVPTPLLFLCNVLFAELPYDYAAEEAKPTLHDLSMVVSFNNSADPTHQRPEIEDYGYFIPVFKAYDESFSFDFSGYSRSFNRPFTVSASAYLDRGDGYYQKITSTFDICSPGLSGRACRLKVHVRAIGVIEDQLILEASFTN